MTATGPSIQADRSSDSSQPDLSRRGRTHLSQVVSIRPRLADCIRLAVVIVLLASTLLALPVDGQSTETAVSQINALRQDDELDRVEASAALDAIASRYLEAILAGGCICLSSSGATSADRLLGDIATALNTDATLRDAGMVAGYDQTLSGAITTVVNDPAHASAILGSRMELVGMASRAVAPEESWLAPPPGGTGPEIDLTGYSIVVIVMAGTTP